MEQENRSLKIQDLKEFRIIVFNLYGEYKLTNMLDDEIEELEDPNILETLERKFQFSKSKEESDRTLARIVKLLPNDYDLGNYIRKLYSTKIS